MTTAALFEDKDKEKNQARKFELNDNVKRWLNDVVKLKQYESVFIENGIDSMEIVGLINKDHLKEMGITKIGHQIKILNAINCLNSL